MSETTFDHDSKSIQQSKSTEPEAPEKQAPQNPLAELHQQVGNQAVQRLLAQRSGDAPSELDDETAGRINSARSGGQTLDGSIQKKMGDAMGTDFSGVRVHTGSEADHLSKDVGAEAFTTGRDIFFREGNYQPNTSSGDELLAHELTHVVQQGEGRVGGGSGMTVNAPGDSFEKEADKVASAVTGPQTAGSVQREENASIQRQDIPEEEEPVQMQEEEEEEAVQMQEEEEEEAVQMQEDEEEEMVQARRQ